MQLVEAKMVGVTTAKAVVVVVVVINEKAGLHESLCTCNRQVFGSNLARDSAYLD
jgi:hypothetical protein